MPPAPGRNRGRPGRWRTPCRSRRWLRSPGRAGGWSDGVGRGLDLVRLNSHTVRTTVARVRLATWNVNSIRSRVDRVVAWLERSDVDVLALQETKCREDQFPLAGLRGRRLRGGAPRASTSGTGSRSRRGSGWPTSRSGSPGMPPWGEPAGAGGPRRSAATCGGGAGLEPVRAERAQPGGPAPATTSWTWLAGLRAAGQGWLAADPDAQVALVGDWNIAPLDDDVWDMAVFAQQHRTSRPASGPRSGRGRGAGFADVVRPFTPRARGLHLLGLHPAAVPAQRGHADRLRPRPRRRWPAGWPAPRSTARSARARAPATTPPWSSSSGSPDAHPGQLLGRSFCRRGPAHSPTQHPAITERSTAAPVGVHLAAAHISPPGESLVS